MTTITDRSDEASFQLRKALAFDPEVAATHAWLWEADRWTELVFAILTRVSGVPEGDVRELTERMTDLNLLDVSELAALDASRNTPLAHRITGLMREMGVPGDRAEAGLTAIVEVARGLNQHYGGKIQRYLRRYGELMLREIDESFHVTSMKPEAVAEAFTYWLQNVLSMPLSLTDQSVQAFCERYGFTPSDLRDAADQIGVNLSVVDDLIQLHMVRHPVEAVSTEQDAPEPAR